MPSARERSLFRLAMAAAARGRRGRPRRRPSPDAGAVPVEPPRTPTLSGGAAAIVED